MASFTFLLKSRSPTPASCSNHVTPKRSTLFLADFSERPLRRQPTRVSSLLHHTEQTWSPMPEHLESYLGHSQAFCSW